MRSTTSVPGAIATLAAAVGVFGVSFGVLAVAAGLSPFAATAMSALVFAGGSQFAAVGVIAAGGGPVAAVVSGLLLNTRYAPFGIAVAPALTGGRLRRALAAHLIIDEGMALALTRDDSERQRVFVLTGLALGATWVGGTGLGALAGSSIGDPTVLGLDVAFPAGFLALLAPLLDRPRTRAAAAAGALIAVALLPVAPPGVPVLAAALGVVAGLALPARAGRGRTADGAGDAGEATRCGGGGGPR
jgi:4-azaleucine resistance transporter AzlC